MISPKKFIKSFKSAVNGIREVIKTEQNFQIHLIAAVLVVSLAIFFQVSKNEWIILLLMIMFVLVIEIINTAIEKFNDLLKPRLHHYVYIIKNIMAGAVLIVSMFAVIIGILIFYPYFIYFVK